jgi:rhodanese-related sulfurtransferase
LAAGATKANVKPDHMTAQDLATLIMNGDASLRLFDLRAPEDFARTHIPGASFATIDMLTRETLPHDATVVLYSEGGTSATEAHDLLRTRGYRRVFVLRDGLSAWWAQVMEPRLPIDATERERADFARAVEVSKFFGGQPREGVPRERIAPASVAGLRRRGC